MTASPSGAGAAGASEAVAGRDGAEEPETLSVDEYRELAMASVAPLDPIELKHTDALGLVLAETVTSPEAVPPYATAARTGWALASREVAGAGELDPVALRLVEVGHEARGLEAGTAARVSAGQPIPPGADAIVARDRASEQHGSVVVGAPVRAGEHVRAVGQDLAPGQQLLPAGRRLRAADIGLLASVGRSRVRCHPAPRVVMLSAGNELVASDRHPGAGQLRDTNGPMLAAMVRQAGAVPFRAGIVRDDRRALFAAIDSNLGHADLFVITGGTRVGDHDPIRDVVTSLGSVRTATVAITPGGQHLFGQIGAAPVFGLPGAPVSAFVGFELFVRPALRVLQGRSDRLRPTVAAALDTEVHSPAGQRSYLRVRLQREGLGWRATPTGEQGAHSLASVVRADGLAEISDDTTRVAAGTEVTVHLLVD